MNRKPEELGIIGQVETCILSLVAITGLMMLIAIPLMASLAG